MPARRPSKVTLLVLALWVVGGTLQSLIAWLLTSSGLIEEGTAAFLGPVLGWGLLFVIFFYYRHQIESWLRR